MRTIGTDVTGQIKIKARAVGGRRRRGREGGAGRRLNVDFQRRVGEMPLPIHENDAVGRDVAAKDVDHGNVRG